MADVERSELDDEEARAWRGMMVDAVDLLLRQAERRLDEDTQGAFQTGSPAAVFDTSRLWSAGGRIAPRSTEHSFRANHRAAAMLAAQAAARSRPPSTIC